MFQKLLIANRGEIACRIIKTAKNLGLSTVAVYSTADHRAKHVFLADEAYCIGEAAAKDSYLNIQKIIQIAKLSNSEAIHPGYGFLSESAPFAKACQEAGLTFIGAPPHSIEAMGDKAAAKKTMEQFGIPLVPGYHGDDQSFAVFQKEAKRIGYPVLLKASAGGGGKGMRRVDAENELQAAYDSAKREAKLGFGDDRLLIEKYVLRPRHIEVQVFADKYGNFVYLNERDCSIQRRHQKIIEEAPAPGLRDETRHELGQAAISCAKAIQYEGAGTVEFLMDEEQRFYFMEMNTRLQVEHPVTEMVHGVDLVEWQILVASGQPLPLTQEHIQVKGHAFEARIYAEDPDNGFLPATGHIISLKEPESSEHIRVDSGIRVNDDVTIYYDPMLAKVITWGANRLSALQEMRHALDEYQLLGVKTNRNLLREITHHSEFMLGMVDTGFIEEHHDELFNKCPLVPHHIFVYAALYIVVKRNQNFMQGNDTSPWSQRNNWHGILPLMQSFEFKSGEQTLTVGVECLKEPWKLCIQDYCFTGHGSIAKDGRLVATLNDRRIVVDVLIDGERCFVTEAGELYQFVLHNPFHFEHTVQENAGSLHAPMPGAITILNVSPGDTVEKGTHLLTLEAMKMEHAVKAPFAGVVEKIHFQRGEQVHADAVLITLKKN